MSDNAEAGIAQTQMAASRASGATGRRLVDQLLKRGESVRAILIDQHVG